jgi:hypothetical protein
VRLLLLLLLPGAIGCTAHRTTVPTVPTDWSVVQALAAGTELAVDLGDRRIRYGRLESVSATGLAIRGRRSRDLLSRQQIERVSTRTATGASRPIARTALIAATIAGALILTAKMMEENPRPPPRPAQASAPCERPARRSRSGSSTSVHKKTPATRVAGVPSTPHGARH